MGWKNLLIWIWDTGYRFLYRLLLALAMLLAMLKKSVQPISATKDAIDNSLKKIVQAIWGWKTIDLDLGYWI